MILTVVSAIFVFGLLVLVHEFGHFVMAKLTGMRVDEFAIGFGPKIFGTKRGETTYSLRAVPLGGFNDIAGMDPTDNPAGDRGYCEKPVFSRMVVILAGAGMNFLLPIILFFGIYATVGIAKPAPEPILGAVVENKPAYNAGLQAGDKILKIDGEVITNWESLTNKLKNVSPQQEISIEYERNSAVGTVSVTPEYNEQSKRVLIGIQSSLIYEPQTVYKAAVLAVTQTYDILAMMVNALVDIFKAPSNAEVTGPIGIAQMAGQVAQTGFIPLLNFAALLSLNLGIINLLPVPALDGGHFINLLIEAVRGKPLSAKALMYTQRAGVALLLLLTLAVTTNDIVNVIFK